MLTIENVQRLKGKVIGQTGYYVESIKPDLNILFIQYSLIYRIGESEIGSIGKNF